ncbi:MULTISPECIES: hypothetical protein [unclassified Brevibacillus]|uniref:hypothetical protein n=1 Tax=unclassified Brevibacillus TaxID=2684853 RepID=UPI00156AD33C|nr:MULTISPECIES: hypothetical protein [unclassified Brevibacillus]MDH6352152.1 hypothetical protein [Brevibacillus sp. 1238]NRQ54514.1 hypothetical protein [Brevibacillus sp. HD1.4A]UED67399.1 hypothetical protein HP435_19135 [Brevibacillus sp. HD3.3A]
MEVIFEPPNLKQELDALFKFCKEYEIEIELDHYYYPVEEGDDEEELDNNRPVKPINYNTSVKLWLPRATYDYDCNLNYILEIVNEAKNGEIMGNFKFIGLNTALIRIDTDNWGLFNRIYEISNLKSSISVSQKIYTLEIIHGLTSFGILLTIEGKFSKYVPPVDSDDVFILISCPDGIENEVIDKLFNSYVFELRSTLGLELHIGVRPDYDPWEEVEPENLENPIEVKLRPLIYGKGINELLEIYNSSSNSHTPENLILAYTRVIEYVSQTVIRKDLIEKTVNKLSSPRALTPDANYILELGKIYEEHRNTNQKDFLLLD